MKAALWGAKTRLQFTGWLQYILTAAAAVACFLVATVGWMIGHLQAVLFWPPVVVGSILFLVFIVLPAKWLCQCVGIVRDPTSDSWRIGMAVVMGGTLLIYLISGMSLELRHFSFFISLFWIAGAVIENLHAESTENTMHVLEAEA